MTKHTTSSAFTRGLDAARADGGLIQLRSIVCTS